MGEFTVPKGIGRDWLRHMSAEVRQEKLDKHGRIQGFWKSVHEDNHLYDCELMITTAAQITGRISSIRGNIPAISNGADNQS
jgi:hypothetical protein